MIIIALVISTSALAADNLAAIRQATAKYHDVDAAIADGYISTVECEANAHGAMGIHYINPALMNDTTIDPLRPEILLYAPSGNDYRLVGVEYFVPAPLTNTTPMLWGQYPFNGPMAGHQPGMPVHYDLHVWLWQGNRDGIFAQFNPAVKCPAE